MIPPLSVEDAARAVVQAVHAQPFLRMPIADSQGHVLAEDLLAPFALPPWTNSAMDGYAARAADIRGAERDAPITLRVVGHVPAGANASRALGPGEAMRIFTGAPVPEGADSVIRQEDTDRGTARVEIYDDRDAGSNVRHAGGDLAQGSMALAAGTAIGPHQLALLAAFAVAHPVVHRKPRVGILVTGDELASLDHPEQILSGQRLADVNGPALAALVADAGGIPVSLGIASDDPAMIRARIEAATDVDLFVTAGGVSVGDHDHMHDVMAALDVKLLLRRVRIRPGGPTAFGILPDGRPWLGLPGNPVSAMVTFELFGRAAIRAMAGHRQPIRDRIEVVVDESITRDATLDLYLRARFTARDGSGRLHARLTGPQGSGILTSVAISDGLVIIESGNGVVEAGSATKGIAW